MNGPRSRRVVVFARTPRAGRVKTRLAAEIGPVAAVWWYRHTLNRLLRTLARDERWEVWVAVTPDNDARRRERWRQRVKTVPQGRGDLGVRVSRALERGMPASVLVVGSDVPDLRARHVWTAFQKLRRARWVLGPSPDGGYWEIGRRGESRRSGLNGLAGVRWSSRHALEDTLARLGASGGEVALAATLADVDTAADLHPSRAGRSRQQ